MAARHQQQLTENWRRNIRISLLLNRLHDHVLGKVNLSTTQVRAAEILLRKVIGDVSNVQLSGEVTQNHVVRAPEVCSTTEEWKAQYTPTIQ